MVCLAWDDARTDDGITTRLPVLVHNMPKVGVVDYRLEIDTYTAELITAQQALVDARFPGTPRHRLALFPRAHRNPPSAPQPRRHPADQLRPVRTPAPRLGARSP